VIARVLRGLGWFLVAVWITAFLIAVVYKDNLIVRGSVETIFISAAGMFADTREMQKLLQDDIQRELKKKQNQ
jgi:hypothetical protein